MTRTDDDHNHDEEPTPRSGSSRSAQDSNGGDESTDSLSFLMVKDERRPTKGSTPGAYPIEPQDDCSSTALDPTDKDHSSSNHPKEDAVKAAAAVNEGNNNTNKNNDESVSTSVNDELIRAKAEYRTAGVPGVATNNAASFHKSKKNTKDDESTTAGRPSFQQSRPGAFGVAPPIGLRNDHDNDDEDTGSLSFFSSSGGTAQQQPAQPQGPQPPTTADTDVELGLPTNANIVIGEPATEELIHAELVVNEETSATRRDDPTITKPVVHAEILKDADTAWRKRRRRAILISLIVLVMGAVVIAVTVGMNQGGGSTQITLAPTTASPTISPTIGPSQAPSESPSSAPSYLSFGVAPSENQSAFELSSIDPNQVVPDYQLISGGKFGDQIFIRDIDGTILGDATEKTTMLAISFEERQTMFTEGFFPYPAMLGLFFCHPEAANAEGSTSCEAGAHIRTADPRGPHGVDRYDSTFAISGNGQMIAMRFDQRIELFDLRAAAPSVLPASTNPLSSIELLEVDAWKRPLGMNHRGDNLVHFNRTHLIVHGLDLDNVGAEAMNTSLSTPSLPLISEEKTWEFLPPCDFPCALPEEIFNLADLVVNNDFILLGANIDVPPFIPPCLSNAPCASSSEPFNGYRLRVFDYDLNPIGNVIETGENRSLVDGQQGIEMAANANVFAVRSAVFPRRDYLPTFLDTRRYQVDVYRLDENTTTWVSMGSTLHGSPEGGDFFGRSISLSGDGMLLSLSTGNRDEAVITFRFDEMINDWVPFGDPIMGPPGSRFGDSVALHPSGEQLLVGAPESNLNGLDTGESFLFGIVGV